MTRRRDSTPGRSLSVLIMLAGIAALGIPFLDRRAIASILGDLAGSPSIIRNQINYRSEKNNHPEVAWLMTYPNSGTTYTLKMIQQYTSTTTATNYGNEQDIHNTSIPVHPSMTDGPFIRLLDRQLPSQYILTKTHCGGTALSSDPGEYVETTRSFEVACRSGNRIQNESKYETTYSMDIPKRAVHLLRNPFDNVVARLHLEQKRWKRMENKNEKLKMYNSTREGFRAWCLSQDRRGYKFRQKSPHYLDEELWDIAKQVPCHAEIIRYTWWHNHAIEVVRQHNIPVHTMFYEDYEINLHRTIEELLGFLALHPSQDAELLVFQGGKHYMEFFDPIDVAMAKRLVNLLASPSTWSLVQRYFS